MGFDSPSVSVPRILIEVLGAGFALGLAGSPHCVGMCGPFALACGGRASHTFGWQAGKLSTYAALGMVAGAAGGAVPGPLWVAQVLSGALVVWFSAALAGLVPEPRFPVPGLSMLASRARSNDALVSRLLFGAANGLLPCGLVYAALGLAVASGSWATGALTMAAFGLGTAPLLTAFALGAHRLTVERPWARRTLALLVLLVGIWVVVRRGAMMPPTP